MARVESHSLEDLAGVGLTYGEAQQLLQEFQLYSPNATREDVDAMTADELRALEIGSHIAAGSTISHGERNFVRTVCRGSEEITRFDAIEETIVSAYTHVLVKKD